MRLVADPDHGGVDLAASAEELDRLATTVAQGAGFIRSAPAPDDNALVGIDVLSTDGPGVRIDLDARQRLAVISGDAPARAALADHLRAAATTPDSEPLRLNHTPDHPYLAEGSLSLIVRSPHQRTPTH
ncbi:hypothetical protein GXW83_17810 [Streptacidiphilus sp. PB12-B1b]|uniref:Imm32 family immunity protein n=1 Tax=Streptacidiphilus sp. PB12-B1b TaxID=2705012 RepID=UPI0015FA01CC|nr:hypothetical protein [Streptacidiphilus sp. PB12-B1b]QMU77275.1 hypothetical protein GXW83_17810 [Streptacidiphilus sp. PB12-B1b]